MLKGTHGWHRSPCLCRISSQSALSPGLSAKSLRSTRHFRPSYPAVSRMSPPIILCTLKTAPRKQRAWDVVDIKEASPTPVYYEHGELMLPTKGRRSLTVTLAWYCSDLEIMRVSPQAITGQYTFDMESEYQCRRALHAARIQLLHEIKKDRYNVLLGEG